MMLSALIVDDEPLALKRLTALLRENGISEECCKCFLKWRDAYDYARSNRVDIAFLDISMPGIDGMKLAEMLRELNESIQVVFVTGYDAYAVQAFEADALDYLLKPFAADRVAKTLARFYKTKGQAVAQPLLTVKLFGGLQILRGDLTSGQQPLRLRSPKTEELFAFLLCHGSVSRELIIDTLWDGLETEKASKNLNSTLYYIRKAVGTPEKGNFIAADRNVIRIDREAINCDLYRFEDVVKQISQQPKNNISSLCKEVEMLYSGPLLQGKSYEWAVEKTRKIEQDYIKVLELAGNFFLEQHRLHDALHYFNEILKIDLLREDMAYQVLSIYLSLGRTNEALRYYRELEKLMGQELGMAPSPLLENLIEQVQHNS